MCLSIRKDRQPIAAQENGIYGRSWNTLFGPVLTDCKVIVVWETLLMFEKPFELAYGFSFVEAKSEHI